MGSVNLGTFTIWLLSVEVWLTKGKIHMLIGLYFTENDPMIEVYVKCEVTVRSFSSTAVHFLNV